MKWHEPLHDLALPGYNQKTAKALEKLDITRVADLATHFPRRYEDRQNFGQFPDEEQEEPVCLAGEITKTRMVRLRGNRTMFEAEVAETRQDVFGKTLTCRWFNAYYIKNALRTGQRVVLYGRLQRSGRKLALVHPEFERLDDDDTGEGSLHFNRLVPVYPTSAGIGQRFFREAIHHALSELEGGEVEDLLPPLDGELTRRTALWHIHFPDDPAQAQVARRHLAMEEMFVMQMLVSRRRLEHESQPGEVHVNGLELLRTFYKSLPFQLTEAQIRVIKEIRDDMQSTRPMNRLLQGDVGSGKTLVAFCAMLLAVEAGFQAALMAPTQILAEQHYLTCKRFMEGLGIRVALRTADRREEDFLPLFEGQGETPQIVIGTHALFYESGGDFENLGLVVIDEQHKFGVVQRSRLKQRGRVPDTLVMTATPIPRTLALTVYGDLDTSVLDERPRNRAKIITAVRTPKQMKPILKFLHEQLEDGRQIYVVYPLIEDSDTLNLKAATTEFEAWQERLAPFSCGLLHGRVKPEEKEDVMRRFRDNEIQVLIATTVIEVGVDVPNATVMLIENAERFGLAQLHQLRGRIGRSSLKSYCILLTETDKPEAKDKLRVLEKTSDGFKIAEEDLRLRGPGNILGTQQSGLPPLKLADMIGDVRLMREARQRAQAILTKDPNLQHPTNRPVRKALQAIEENYLEVG